MLKGSEPNDIENWVCVLEGGTEYEIEMAKNYLSDHDIPASILSKRDSSFSVNFGEMGMVYLYVPNEYEDEARDTLSEFDAKGLDNEEE